jgi:hypothetical protein
MATYGVVRTDNVKATKDGNIKSGRYYVTTTATAIDNGNIVKLDSLLSASTNREIWKVVAAGAVTTPNCYLVGTPEVIYSEETKASGALDQFVNPAGANITLIGLEVGDTFAISDECITPINDDDDLPAVGSYVAPGATGTKFVEVASIAQSEVFYGKIIARELYKKDTYLNVVEMISVR